MLFQCFHYLNITAKINLINGNANYAGDIFETYNIHKNRHVEGIVYDYLPRCLHCFPKNNSLWSSKEEKELTDFCKIYFPELKPNNFDIINPYELDIYIAELKLAIEFNRALLSQY